MKYPGAEAARILRRALELVDIHSDILKQEERGKPTPKRDEGMPIEHNPPGPRDPVSARAINSMDELNRIYSAVAGWVAMQEVALRDYSEEPTKEELAEGTEYDPERLSYSPEYKARIVELVSISTAADIARVFKLPPDLVRKWVERDKKQRKAQVTTS